MLTIVIRLIVITVLVYVGVQLWYGKVETRLQQQAASKVEQQEQTVEQSDSLPAQTDSSDDAIQVILSRNIFQAGLSSETEGEVERPQSPIDQLARTQLSLSLLGTVTGNSEDTRAIIRDDKTGLEDLYRVGSEIQGATIRSISRGEVVLLVNGREEALVIKEREGGDGNDLGRVSSRMPVAVGEPEEHLTQPTPKAVPRRRISFRSAASRPPAVAPQEMNEVPTGDAPIDDVQGLPGEPEGELNASDQEAEPGAEGAGQ